MELQTHITYSHQINQRYHYGELRLSRLTTSLEAEHRLQTPSTILEAWLFPRPYTLSIILQGQFRMASSSVCLLLGCAVRAAGTA